MFHLIETIKCSEGKLVNIDYHQARFDLSRKAFFRSASQINLSESVSIPEECKKGIFKCRMLYAEEILHIEFLPYWPKNIRSLKIVEDNHVDYRFKFADRKILERLYAQRGSCDDILIVKKGFISDCFTSNVIFHDGKKWWTSETPLLPGTQRAKLIHERKVLVCSITLHDLPKFEKTGLINTMQDLDAMPVIQMKNIIK